MILKMSNEEKRQIVLKGNLYKGLLVLSIPIVVNNLMHTLYNLADTLWVSKISKADTEVSAISLVWPVLMLFIAFGMGIQIAGTSLMSQYIGANEKEKASKLASQIFMFSFLIGLLMMVLAYLFAPSILHLMRDNKDPETYILGLSYLRIMFIGISLDFCLLVFTSMRQAYGDTLTPVLFTGSSVILNVLLDPLFIIIFKLGVPGVAYATILAKLIVMPFWLHKAFLDKKSIHLIIKHMKLKWKMVKKIVKVMIPASFSGSLTALGFTVLNAFIISYGDSTMAAFGIGNRITSLIMMPAMGIGSALAFYIGQNIGNENYKRAKESFYTSLKLTLLMMFIGMVIILPYPVRINIVKIFLREEESITLAVTYMMFVGLNIPLMGIFQNFNGVFVGSGKSIYSFIMSMTRLWGIRIPLILIFKHFTNLGSSGIWYAMVLSNVIVCILGLFLYKFGEWKRKIV
ncbi:MATE family efflux transporter [Mycoplasmatota bacterium]|nr:MATE family efflux transporter [Mycoplasmatota bacterium]